MRTDFPVSEDPRMNQSEEILRTCVHCGMCNAACPTYSLTGSELDGPRGRIYLIKNLLEGDAESSPIVRKHLDNCLTCLACVNACPSGVDYAHLLDHGREVVETTPPRSLSVRLFRYTLAVVLTRPKLFALSLAMARWVAPFKAWMPSLLRPLFDSLPEHVRKPAATPTVPQHPRARVALLDGCVQQIVAPHINAATASLLARHGVESVACPEVSCCGALQWHLGFHREARARARDNIRAWLREVDGEGIDSLVMTASGCGAVIRDYPAWFHDDPETKRAAERIASMTKDVAEYVAGLETRIDDSNVLRVGSLSVAYHGACSLANGGRFEDKGRETLECAGFSLCPPPTSGMCCGSAGAYHLLRPGFSNRLGERKIAELEALKPKVIATGNIGCMMQIRSRTGIPVVHTVELLEWAAGGDAPESLA